MAAQTADALVLLDDGEYYIDLNVNYPEVIAPGFLQRRCYVGVTTPDGYECIGSFDRTSSGKWSATIDAPYDPRTDSDAVKLGESRERLDAIAALWGARRQAHCRHQAE